MGFLSGLTSNALVSTSLNKESTHQDISNIPASVQDHTTLRDAPHDVEKMGTPRTPTSVSESDDASLNKVDTTAEPGVQAVQAATHVWTKRDLILAYVLYVAPDLSGKA
jgi:hypothetical protein